MKMKKNNLLILAVAALGFAACSSDETTAVNEKLAESNEISFRANVAGQMRAADEHFNVANDQFAVTAFKKGETSNPYFDNVTFKTTDGTTFTSEDGKYYWPSSTNLDFYAYAPLNSENTGVTRSTYNSFSVTPGTTVASQPDFVYAVTRNWGKATTDQTTGHVIPTATGVRINFRHAESKIAFMLANTNKNLKITVGDVSIGNLRGSETFTWNGVTDGTTPVAAASANTDGQYTSGTLTYLNGTWTASSDQTSAYTVTMESDASYNVFNGNVAAKNLYSAVASAPNYDMILIPQALNVATTYYNAGSAAVGDLFKGAYITVKIKIQNSAANADEYIVGSASGGGSGEDANGYITAMWPLTALTWLPGHKYTYTIDLAGGGYYTTNQDDSSDLDPILEGAEIKFVSVTVDDWGAGDATSVYTGTPASTPVVP